MISQYKVWAVAIGAGLAVVSGARATRAGEDAPSSRVHPIYAFQPEAPFNDLARGVFSRAVKAQGLRPLEEIDIDAPARPHVVDALALGKAKVRKLAFDEATGPLTTVVQAAVAHGGAGLSTDELSDLYLFHGMTVARADWKPQRSVDAAAQAAATADYAQAVIFTPTRALNPREIPPQVIDDWARALGDVHARPHGTLVVRGSTAATIIVDGAAPVPLTTGGRDVVYGPHLVHVDEVGYPPWSAVVNVDQPTVEVVVPARPALVLDDQVAGAHARRMDAPFALVAEVKIGAPTLQLELRLVDATGIKHDATLIALGGAEQGTVDAAVLRLRQEATRIERLNLAPAIASDALPAVPTPDPSPTVVLTVPPPARPHQDPWPFIAIVGVILIAGVGLSLGAAGHTWGGHETPGRF